MGVSFHWGTFWFLVSFLCRAQIFKLLLHTKQTPRTVMLVRLSNRSALTRIQLIKSSFFRLTSAHADKPHFSTCAESRRLKNFANKVQKLLWQLIGTSFAKTSEELIYLSELVQFSLPKPTILCKTLTNFNGHKPSN